MRSKFKYLLAKLFCKLFQLTSSNSWSVFISSRLSHLSYVVFVNGKKLNFLSSTELLLYRSKTIHDKEPGTNKWISQMPADGVFYDVGEDSVFNGMKLGNLIFFRN